MTVDKPHCVALVPLRGGSKGIPGKNIRPLAGKPLCAWVLEAACGAACIDQVWVSTDSQDIADCVKSLGLNVSVLDRPPELATDTASTESVMLHFTQNVKCDILCTIQATSPLLVSSDLDKAFEHFVNNQLDSLVTGVRTKRFFWTTDSRPLNYDPSCRPRRQDFDGLIMENGAFYMTRSALLAREKCRLGGKIGVYEMDEDSAIEIDELHDWAAVEKLLLTRHHRSLKERIQQVKMLMCDVDGTLTDAGMYFGPEGEALKKFNTRDGMGLNLVRKLGIGIAIVTAENSAVVTARCKKLKIDDCFLGISDKRAFVENFCAQRNLELHEIAFIGDDLNDREVMSVVGLAACPADAAPEVAEVAHFISAFNGGQGAVRNLCNLICQHSSARK